MQGDLRALVQVNYDVLDRAKRRFIETSKSTLNFASEWGHVVNSELGASANLFSLAPSFSALPLMMSLVSEGLGSADDARPEDLTTEELVKFWWNIGIKTVSVMTNDAASAGLQPLLLSLYLPSATPELVFHDAFLEGFLGGVVSGCRDVGCVYISGETPQLETKLIPGRLDIAGATVALCPPGHAPISGESLGCGDRIVFIGSSGPHENGFTALRDLAGKLPRGFRTRLPRGIEFWEAINAPSVLYTRFVQRASAVAALTAIEPVTGHGWQKIMRSSKSLRYRISRLLPMPELFSFVQSESGSSWAEMLRTFNCGVGLVVFVKATSDAAAVVRCANELGLSACVAGIVEEADAREVLVEPLDVCLSGASFLLSK